MRASSHKRTARAAASGGIAAVALLLSGGALADDPGALRAQADRLRASNASLAEQSREALLQLYALESRLAGADRRLRALEARSAELERREAAEERLLAVARDDLTGAEAELARRLRTLYIEGDVDPLAVLLGAQSLDEALSALDGLGRLADQDAEIVAQLREARSALHDALARLAERRAELDAALTQAKSARDALLAARSERSAFLAELARQRGFNADRISALTDEAAAVEARASEIQAASTPPAPPSTETAPPPPVASGGRLTVSSTGYCLKGTTATGVPVAWGVVAVDPSVIPLGTRMSVPGYGEGVAADTGSAVRGATIDLWFPTCAQASGWGRRTVTITLH